MSTLAERLSQSMEKAGLNAQGLSRKSGVTHTSISYWLSGRNKGMRAETAQKVANALGVSALWLATGDETPAAQPEAPVADDECVLIPVLGLRASAGFGYTPSWEDMEETGDKIPRLRSWFHKHHLNPASCCFLGVKGDSMEPTIWDGDKILVNRAYQPILAGKVYAFFIDGDLRVMRLIQKLDGTLIIRSDNSGYPEEELPSDERDRFQMIGRVVDRQGSANL